MVAVESARGTHGTKKLGGCFHIHIAFCDVQNSVFSQLTQW